MITRRFAASMSCGFLLAGTSFAQSSHEHCPHKASEHEAMMQRGEKGMGFSQTDTAHHFLFKPDGGVIAVSASDPKNTEARDQIRMHLTHMAHAFSVGDFDIPMFVHDQKPPGVSTMKRLAKDIHYKFRETGQGGEVEISSESIDAVKAIHDFLVFQIREHKTGDPVPNSTKD